MVYVFMVSYSDNREYYPYYSVLFYSFAFGKLMLLSAVIAPSLKSKSHRRN